MGRHRYVVRLGHSAADPWDYVHPRLSSHIHGNKTEDRIHLIHLKA